MAKLYNITLTAATPPTIGYTVYYNSVNASTIATIGLAGGPATGLTKAQLVSPGLKVSVPDSATSVILYNLECTSSTNFTVPTSVTVTASASSITSTSLILSWTVAPTGVATSYLIFKNGVLYSTISSTSQSVSGLTMGTTYNFAVQAKDVNGNVVGISNSVIATTLSNSVSFSSYYSIGGTSGTTAFSGTVTITGTTATFRAFATVNSGGPCNTSINVGGNTRTASRSGVGTNYSTTFTLSPGTYSYSGSTTISSGYCNAGIEYPTQP